MKMPPPRRANTEISEPPKPRPTSALQEATPEYTKKENRETDRMPKPITNMPVTVPDSNATRSAAPKPVRAASAVRTLAATEMRMPINPAAAEAAPPSKKPRAVQMPNPETPMKPGMTRITAITTAAMATVLYWRAR